MTITSERDTAAPGTRTATLVGQVLARADALGGETASELSAAEVDLLAILAAERLDDGRVRIDLGSSTGTLAWDGGEAAIVDTRYGDGGAIVHILEEGASAPAAGTAVHGVLDWERRYQLMRTHTAMHILCGVIWRDYGASVTGGNMEPGRARMDFELENISVEFGREVEERLAELTRWQDVVLGREERIHELKREVNALLRQQGEVIRYASQGEAP